MITNGLCNAEHPDWPLRCCRAPHIDETHEGYGEVWTDPNSSDERGWFWMRWSRLMIAWCLILTGALVIRTGHLGVPLHIVVNSVAIGAAACVAKLTWNAVKFVVDNRREHR